MKINNNHIKDNLGPTNVYNNEFHIHIVFGKDKPGSDLKRNWLKRFGSWISNNAVSIFKIISG
jgi:hypothetical protein